MFKHLSLMCLLLAIIPSSVFAAPKGGEKVGEVGNVTPYAEKRSGSCSEDAKKSSKIADAPFRQFDCFMTGDGASVQLFLKNEKSSITINEKSLVSVDSMVTKNAQGNFEIKLNIKKGILGFDVQGGNNVDFRTGNAAASIRGTDGAIGGDDKSFFGGLKGGRLWIYPDNGDSLTIGAGQTALGREKFAVLNLKSSGDTTFAKTLVALLADSTLSFDELTAAVVKADSAYQDSIASNKTSAEAPVQKEEKVEEQASLTIPQIKYSSYDSLRCVANVSVSEIQQGTEARLSALMDGTPISEIAVKRNMPKRVSLRSGVHEYEFVVENSAGHSSVKKTLGCYPMKSFSVKVFGGKHVTLTIPPPPPEVEDVITQTLQFQIRLPENDPSFLNRVTVRQNGKVILQERLSQIQNLDYQIPVELKRAHKNRFDIEVIHKSGYAVKTFKVYEVRK